MKTLQIKKLHPDAVIPTRAHKTDAGLDLYALEDTQIKNGQCGLVKTGIAVSIPEGYEGQVRPRSGMTLKTDFKVQLGTIDCGYEGDVGVIVYNSDVRNLNKAAWVSKGSKIAQLVISPIVTPSVKVVDDFKTQSDRGDNGFGSTDEVCPECGSNKMMFFGVTLDGRTSYKCSHCENIENFLRVGNY